MNDTVQWWQLRKSLADVIGGVIILIVCVKSMEDVKHEVVNTFQKIHFSLETREKGRLNGWPGCE